jgi:hypothetical protein
MIRVFRTRHLSSRAVLAAGLWCTCTGCDSVRGRDEATAHETQQAMRAIEGSSGAAAAEAAARELAERNRLRASITEMKGSLAALGHDDDEGRQRLLSSLKSTQEEHWRRITGRPVTNLDAKPDSPLPTAQQLSTLLSKLDAYDMSNPDHVAAWAELNVDFAYRAIESTRAAVAA